jgi:hypothetical protein
MAILGDGQWAAVNNRLRYGEKAAVDPQKRTLAYAKVAATHQFGLAVLPTQIGTIVA